MADVATQSQGATREDVTAPRIVLVEDDARARRALQRDLVRAGFSVNCADDGATAVEIYERCGADLIITDLKMPRMDGLELTLKMSVTHPNLPIIAMSGAAPTDTNLLSASERGAVVLLTKPFASSDLVDAVWRVLGLPPSTPGETLNG